MKKRIYGIIICILMVFFTWNTIVFASQPSRVYINEAGLAFEEDDDAEEEEEDDDEDEEDEGEGDEEGGGPGTPIGPTVDEDDEPTVSTSPSFEDIGSRYWVGWRKHHYGYEPSPTTYKSQEITFRYRVIRNGVSSYETSTAVASGYGIYNMDYSKHMVGFLNYANANFGENYQSTFVDKSEVVFTGESEPTANPINIKEACLKVMKKVVETWYSKDYEEKAEYDDAMKADGFRKFWTENFDEGHADAIRKVQNKFFQNVYASEAVSKLNSFIGKFKSSYQPAIRGVIFSIMEARYRNKDLQGKTNLKLKVAEKELWPFYVYCTKDASGHVVWPENDGDYYGIDKVIDGAYQWMYYYDSQFISTSHSTLTSYMEASETEDEPAEADWEAEYEELTGKEFPYLYGDDLQAFYDRVTQTRTTFTESADNAEGIFGAEERYTITSDFSFGTAMVKMENAMHDFCKGTAMENIWTGLTEENVARSYMMAKNIVENEKVQSEYAYYDIGTNILTYSAGRQDSTILLKDLQRVKLKQSINDPGNADTDEDGINDKNELKSIGFPVDITKFVEKMVMAELYGKEQDSISDADKNSIMTGFINNVRSRATEKRDDNSAECGFGAEGNKLMVYLYDYTSNPVIKDTDFDGLTDKEENDRYVGYTEFATEVINNKISGNMQTQDGQSVPDAETHMDYRYFFMNNKNYYDELSTMSLMLCNAFENPNTNELNNINTLFDRIGMNDNFLNETATIGSDYKIDYITATNDIEYTHNADETPIKKKVKLIVVKSIDTSNPSLKNIENIGEKGDSSDYYSNNHETFDKLAKAIYDRVYVNNSTSTSTDTTLTYWITGYNTGGAVANILSARIIDSISSVKSNADAVNVYAYTFGAPYTVYNFEGEAINTTASKYCSIYNVTNEADIYAYMPPQRCGWSRYGVTCYKKENNLGFILNFMHNVFNPNVPVKNDRVLVEGDAENIYENKYVFRSKYYDASDKKTDEYIMHEIMKTARIGNMESVVTNIDDYKYCNDNNRRDGYRQLVKDIKDNLVAFRNAKNLSLYYKISKEIVPNDITFKVSSDTKGYKGEESSQDYKTAAKKMMEWYVAHVATYQHKHDNGKYTNGSDEAERYYIEKGIDQYVTTNNDSSNGNEWYTNYYQRGRYYCQAYFERMNGTHQWVGDDCTGFMMAVIGYYAGDSLKDDDYAISSSENFQINNIGTPTISGYTKKLADWLSTQAQMYIYKVNRNTTVNDLEFGDFLIATKGSSKAKGGHAEMYIDSEHTWGWGMKHCKMYDLGSDLGWKGSFSKKNTENYFKWNRKDITKANNLFSEAKDNYCDERQYTYVISPNPNKMNMDAQFSREED